MEEFINLIVFVFVHIRTLCFSALLPTDCAATSLNLNLILGNFLYFNSHFYTIVLSQRPVLDHHSKQKAKWKRWSYQILT